MGQALPAPLVPAGRPPFWVGDEYDGPQEHWIAALQGRAELLPTAEIALAAMLISEGIYLSEKLSREVTADEVRKASVSTAVDL
jgi:predicted dehydrogenase